MLILKHQPKDQASNLTYIRPGTHWDILWGQKLVGTVCLLIACLSPAVDATFALLLCCTPESQDRSEGSFDMSGTLDFAAATYGMPPDCLTLEVRVACIPQSHRTAQSGDRSWQAPLRRHCRDSRLTHPSLSVEEAYLLAQ